MWPLAATGPRLKEGAAATAVFRKNRDPEEVQMQQLSESSVRGMSWKRKYSTRSLIHHDVTRRRFKPSQNHFDKLPQGTQPGKSDS